MRERDSAAPTRRRRRLGTAIVALCTLALVLAACGGQLSRVAAQVAQNTGRSADDVIAGIKRLMPGATDDELAAAIRGAAADTEWIAAIAARQSDDAARTARAVHGAACRYVPMAEALSAASPDEAQEAILQLLIGQIEAEGLTATRAKMEEIAAGVDEHLLPLLLTGRLDDPAGALLDLGCLF